MARGEANPEATGENAMNERDPMSFPASEVAPMADRPPTFGEALGVRGIIETLRAKAVPKHKHSVWYLMGGLTLFFFTVQIITGVLLLIYFEATSEQAGQSLAMIIQRVPFGWLIRSMHSWSASFAMFFLFVHMFSAFFLKSYRAPRIVLWVTGVMLLALMLEFGYSGYLLPQLHGVILRRLFAVHVTVLPLLGALIVTAHISLSALLGNTVPIKAKVTGWTRFFPNYVLSEAILWLMALGVLLLVAWFFRWEFNGWAYAPKGALGIGIPSDWFIAFLLEYEQLVPGLAGSALLAALAMIWLLMPWLDRSSKRGERRGAVTWIGVIAVGVLVILTALAYFSVIPGQ